MVLWWLSLKELGAMYRLGLYLGYFGGSFGLGNDFFVKSKYGFLGFWIEKVCRALL